MTRTTVVVASIIALFLTSSALAQHADHRRLDWEGKHLQGVHGADKGPENGDYTPGSERYDLVRTVMDVRLDTDAASIAGTVKHVFTSLDDTLRTVVLDLADGYGLIVSSVTGTSGDLVFSHADDALLIQLPGYLAAGTVDSVTVAYSGSPSSPDSRRGLWLEHHGSGEDFGPIFASLSQPAYAKYWWPCKDRTDDKIDHLTLRYTVREGQMAAGAGLLMSETSPEAGWTTFEWVSTYPIATYLVSVAVSNYVTWSEICSIGGGIDMPLVNFVYPEDLEASHVEFGPTCDMVIAGEDWFGSYPFAQEKYGHAEFEWAGAMEHQTCTSFGSGFISENGYAATYVMHELAHQWFGNSLTPRIWADIWLNEGFATYSEALWAEQAFGEERYHRFMRVARDPFDWEGQGPVYDPTPVFPGRIIYDKGAWMLHMLRGRIDDDTTFFQLLRDWAQDDSRPYGDVITDEFIDHCEGYVDHQLDNFFWPYLTEEIMPQVALQYEVAAGGADPDTVKITLQQTQTPLFDNIYSVQLNSSDGDLFTRIHLSGQSARASVALPSPTATLSGVILDPGAWVLWQGTTVAGRPSGLKNVYPNPARDDWIIFAYDLKDVSSVEVLVYDVMGRKIRHQDLGQVAPGADGNSWTWDCHMDGGEQAPSGMYWAAIKINGERTVKKFTVIR